MRIHRNLACSFYIVLLAASVAFFSQAPSANAQARVNDKDMTAMMRNLRDDSKSFRSSFDSAVRKSTIRKTSQAKDAKNLVATFEKQTNHMLDRFKKHRKGEADLDAVISTAQQIDALLNSVQFEPVVPAKWERIRTELHTIAAAYGVHDNFRDHAMDSDRGGTD